MTREIPQSIINMLWARVEMHRETGNFGRGFRYDIEALAPYWPESLDWQKVPVSVEAQKILNANEGSKISRFKLGITWEHEQPLSVITKMVLATSSKAEMMQVLKDYLRCSYITREEDKRMNAMGLRSKMPAGLETVAGARYQVANIKF